MTQTARAVPRWRFPDDGSAGDRLSPKSFLRRMLSLFSPAPDWKLHRDVLIDITLLDLKWHPLAVHFDPYNLGARAHCGREVQSCSPQYRRESR